MDAVQVRATSRTPSPIHYDGKRPSRSNLDRWLEVSTMEVELKSLQNSFSRLDEDLSEGPRPTRSVRFALHQIKGSITRLSTQLDALIDRIPINHRPTADSAIQAQRLFNIPEMLEKILLHCALEDLMSAHRVNQTFAKVMSSSTKIQERLGLRAVYGCSPWSPLMTSFFIRHGCIVRLEGINSHNFDSKDISLTASLNAFGQAAEVPLPRLGSRLRQMLVCQPPVTRMRVRTNCCDQGVGARAPSPEEDGRQLPEIHSTTGITLGDLLDATRRLRHEHRYCPDAFEGLHRDDGTVNVHVDFEMSVRLRSQDPLLVARRRARDEHVKRQGQLRARDEQLTAYIAAKQAARDAGRPIPSLAQFNAENESDEGSDDDDDDG